MYEQYQAQLAEARTEAAQIRAQAQADKLAMVEEARTEAAEAAAAVTARAEAAIAAERRVHRGVAAARGRHAGRLARGQGRRASPSRTTPAPGPRSTASSPTSRPRPRAGRATDARILPRVLRRAADVLDARRARAGLRPVPGDLLAVAGVLGREKSLRQALADSGQPVELRAGIAGSLFGRQDLAGTSMAVLTDVVSAPVVQRRRPRRRRGAARRPGRVHGRRGRRLARPRSRTSSSRFGRALDESPELQMALTDPSLGADAQGGRRAATSSRARRRPATVAGARVRRGQPPRPPSRRPRSRSSRGSPPSSASACSPRSAARSRSTDEQQRRLASALTRLQGRDGPAQRRWSTPRSSAASWSAWATTSSTAAWPAGWNRRVARCSRRLTLDPARPSTTTHDSRRRARRVERESRTP